MILIFKISDNGSTPWRNINKFILKTFKNYEKYGFKDSIFKRYLKAFSIIL